MEESEQARSARFDQVEGLPSANDALLEKFRAGRDALARQEERQRSDYEFKSRVSPIAKQAAEIVDRIRKSEQETLWTGEYEDLLGKKSGFSAYPGMMFQLAKDRMEKSKIWEIVRRLPKGALLHCHLGAMVDIDWLIRQALGPDSAEFAYFQSTDLKLTTVDGRERATIRLNHRPKMPASKVDLEKITSVWSDDYVPGTLVPALAAAHAFPDGGFEGFVAWMVDRCTITASESLRHHEGVNEIWRKFRSTFGVVDDIMLNEIIFRKFLRKFFSGLVEDRIQWVDIRTTFGTPFLRAGQTEYDGDFIGMMDVFEDELESFKATEEGKSFWGARFIWTAIRHADKYGVIESMKECVRTKLHFPHLIGGFDFVGQEDLGRTLSDLTPEIFWFRKHCAENGVEIPFFFHAGETNETGGPTDNNLFDAILLGTRRIGHGFSLYKHPVLIDIVKEKDVLVESCPISNEVLRLTSSICTHPLPALLARGVAVSLSNDDPAILGQGITGMSHDFWQALQGWDNLGLAGLGSLAENSVRWANFFDDGSESTESDSGEGEIARSERSSITEWRQQIRQAHSGQSVRALRLRQWAEEWELFCGWIVKTYGQAG